MDPTQQTPPPTNQSVSHPQAPQPMQPQQPVPPSPHKHLLTRRLIIAIILITLLTLVAIAGISARLATQSKKVPKSTGLESVSKTITPTPNPTANWKTFSNSEFSFSVNYPSDWLTSDVTSQWKNTTLGEVFYRDQSQNAVKDIEPPGISITITQTTVTTLTEYINEQIAKINQPDYTPSAPQIIQLGGQQAFLYTNFTPVVLGNIMVFLKKDKYIYTISLNPYTQDKNGETYFKYYKDVFDRMLSTFTFLNSGQSTVSPTQLSPTPMPTVKICPMVAFKNAAGQTCTLSGPNCEKICK